MLGRFLLMTLFLLNIIGRTQASVESPSVSNLIAKINSLKVDSQKVAFIKTIYLTNKLPNIDSEINFLEQAYTLVAKQGSDYDRAEILTFLANDYSQRRQLALAEEKLREALSIFTKYKNVGKMAGVYNFLGVVEGRRNNYDEAIKYFFKALRMHEKENYKEGMISSYVKLGVAYGYTGDFDKAIGYLQKGLALLDAGTLSVDYLELNNNIGTIYARQHKFDTALMYFEKAALGCGDTTALSICVNTYMNIGSVYDELHNIEKAKEYLNKALEMSRKINMPEENIRILLSLAVVESYSNLPKSLSVLKEALTLAEKINDKMLISDALSATIDVYKTMGDSKQALSLLERKSEIDREILNVQKATDIENLEKTYELEKTQNSLSQLKISETKILKQKYYTQIALLILAISKIALLFFLWKTIQLNKKLKGSEKKLKEANFTKDRLVSVIGHDLRNPMVNLNMVLEAMSSGRISEENAGPLIEQLRDDTHNTIQTLENLLNWGKMQMDGIKIKPETFYINEQIATDFRQLKQSAFKKGVRIENQIPDFLKVEADKEMVKIIVRNLLHNAIKFTPKGGLVIIDSQINANGMVQFRVKDNGVGLTDDAIANLFNQVGNSQYGTNNEKGNGIGLSLCYQFVMDNGGAIWAKSNSPEQGSSFFFTLKCF